MKVCGLLAWYDESPRWLQAAVQGAAKLCDHVIAVDGAYALYPRGRAWSVPEQSHAIIEAAYAAGIGCTVHHPADVWRGNQIEKRTLMFRLAAQVVEETDWLFVFDADDLVTAVPADVRARLERASEDVAAYTLWWNEDMHATPGQETAAQSFAYPHEAANRYHRGLFRALPGLRVDGAHYVYVAERDGETVCLRGHKDVHTLEPFLDLTDLRVQHRHPQRTRARLEVSDVYDRLVRAQGLEKVTAADWAAAAAGV